MKNHAPRHSGLDLLCACLLLSACGGGSGGNYGGDNGGNDNDAPAATVVFPPAGALFTGDTLIVRGTATDSDGSVSAVSVNGVAATSTDSFATWTAAVPLERGDNTLTVTVTDDEDDTGTASVDIVADVPLMGSPTGIVFVDADTVLLLDSGTRTVFSVELAGGPRTPAVSPLDGEGPALTSPLAFDVTADGSTAYVADGLGNAIVALDLASGDRTVIASDTVGTGEPLGTFTDLALDEDDNRVFVPVTDGLGAWRLIEIDLATGERVELASENAGGAANVRFPWSVIADPDNDRVLIGGRNGEIVAVDDTTGALGVLTTPAAELAIGVVADLAFDAASNAVYALSSSKDTLWEVDLATGDATEMSGPNRGDGQAFAVPAAVGFDGTSLLVTDVGNDALFSVNTANGNRTVVDTGDVRVGDGEPFTEGNYLVVSEAEGVAYAAEALAQLVRIDLGSGARTTIAAGNAPAHLSYMMVDEANGRLLALASDFAGSVSLHALALDGDGDWSELHEEAGLGNMLNSVLLDVERNRVVFLMQDTDTVHAMSLDDFSVAAVSEPADGEAIRTGFQLALDAAHDRILLGDDDPTELKALALGDGARSDLIDEAGNDDPAVESIGGIAVHGDSDGYLVDGGGHAILRMNLDTLERERIAGDGAASTAPLGALNGIVVSQDGEFAWTMDAGAGALVLVDLVTGEHVVISH